MKLFDIDSLNLAGSEVKYDLFEPTYNSIFREQAPYLVDSSTEMRLDKICWQLYQTINEVDYLCNLNDIDNPLNVMEDDVIFYTNPEVIDDSKLRKTYTTNTREQLINSNKSSKKDTNREKYIENNYQLQPSFNEVPKPAARIEGDFIVIG